MIRPLDHIAAMQSYALADNTLAPDVTPVFLSQNECFRPPSPKATAAARSALDCGALYPDPDWTDVRQAIAGVHGLDASRIVCGNGSLDLIARLAHAFAGPGRAVMAPTHAYSFFKTAAQMSNARFDAAPEQDLTVSVDALLDAASDNTGLVFIANPGNPTGTRITKDALMRLRAGLRPDILLVIDEAYGEFADHLAEPGFDLVNHGNTIILRSLSKAYAMAGYRVGWGYMPAEIATEIRKVLNPNNVSHASQAAAAAAVRDQDYMRETCAMTAALKASALRRLRKLGLDARDSFTNFILIVFSDETVASAVNAELRARGIHLRAQNAAGLSHCLRMTIGTEPQMKAALAAIEQTVAKGMS